MAIQKKKMVKDGKLGKHGEKLDGVTPNEWSRDYVDYNRDEVSSSFYIVLPFLSDHGFTVRVPRLDHQPPLQWLQR